MGYELLVGLRYLRARRRNRFISINSLVSMIGIAVGVWALIVVLSVMNGFQKEVRTRILGVASHVQISGAGNRLSDWQSIAKLASQHEHVLATAPFVQAQAMLSNGQAVRGAIVRGIVPVEEEKVADLGSFATDRHAHEREGVLALIVGLGDRKRDARIVLHVLRVPGEPADVHVEAREIARRHVERHRHERRACA